MREQRFGRRRSRLRRGRAIIGCQSRRRYTIQDMLISALHMPHDYHLSQRRRLYQIGRLRLPRNMTMQTYRRYLIASRATFTPLRLAFRAHHLQVSHVRLDYEASHSATATVLVQEKIQEPIFSCFSPHHRLQLFQTGTNHELLKPLPLPHQNLHPFLRQ
jgi:hypothetical protein